MVGDHMGILGAVVFVFAMSWVSVLRRAESFAPRSLGQSDAPLSVPRPPLLTGTATFERKSSGLPPEPSLYLLARSAVCKHNTAVVFESSNPRLFHPSRCDGPDTKTSVKVPRNHTGLTQVPRNPHTYDDPNSSDIDFRGRLYE